LGIYADFHSSDAAGHHPSRVIAPSAGKRLVSV
jgi:hypothetical protein